MSQIAWHESSLEMQTWPLGAFASFWQHWSVAEHADPGPAQPEELLEGPPEELLEDPPEELLEEPLEELLADPPDEPPELELLPPS